MLLELPSLDDLPCQARLLAHFHRFDPESEEQGRSTCSGTRRVSAKSTGRFKRRLTLVIIALRSLMNGLHELTDVFAKPKQGRIMRQIAHNDSLKVCMTDKLGLMADKLGNILYWKEGF